MTEPNDAAFPSPISEIEDRGEAVFVGGDYGMTKRELFAAMAMQWILAATGCFVMQTGDTTNVGDVSDMSVKAADALIAALNKGCRE